MIVSRQLIEREAFMPRESAGVRSARFKEYGPQARTLFRQMNIPEQLREVFAFLGIITDRAAFVALIEWAFPRGTAGYALIMLAFDTAKHEHWERRRHSGEREFKHLLRCALILWIFCGIRDADRIAAMFLHDLIETFPRKWTEERLRRMFGDRVVYYVCRLTKARQGRGVTKRENERYYYEVQLANSPKEVVEKKGVDVLDNLMTLWKRSSKRLGRKIDDVVRFALPLLRKHELKELHDAIVLVLWTIRKKLRNGDSFAH